MTKTTLHARIDLELKEKAENILLKLGITPSSAITMFYKQIVLENGMPFEFESSNNINFDEMSFENIDEELEKGYQDIIDGKVVPVDEAFNKIYKNLNS